MEGHRLWTQALLYDQITVTNSNVSTVLGLYNLGDYGSGHGWASANLWYRILAVQTMRVQNLLFKNRQQLKIMLCFVMPQ